MTRRLLDFGPGAALLECADLAEALSLLPVIAESVPEITEVVPGARTLLLRFGDDLPTPLRQHLLTVPGRPATEDRRDPVLLEVDYTGADLAEVAELTGSSPAEVVERHTRQLWTVGFCGFAPGFGYLQGTDDRLVVPRRSTPRTSVPSGAVGLAGPWSGVYPRAGPGGWQLIGRTNAVLWDLDRNPPALLQPGRRVQFVAV